MRLTAARVNRRLDLDPAVTPYTGMPDSSYSRRDLIWPKTSIFDAILIVIIGEYIYARAIGMPETFFDSVGTTVFNAGWAAAPFALLWAFHSPLEKRGNLLLASAAGLALIFAGWTAHYRSGYLRYMDGAQDGAQIPMSLIILMLPVLVFAMMLFISLVTRLRGN